MKPVRVPFLRMITVLTGLVVFLADAVSSAQVSGHTPSSFHREPRAFRREAVAEVVVYPHESRALQLAAKDLAQYLGTMLGRRVPVRDALPTGGDVDYVFVLGTPASRHTLPGPLAEHLAPSKLDGLGPDGCLAACVPPVLLLAGNTGRGAANAVWTYLEEYCHVGFFWDMDHVSQLDTLPFNEVAFSYRPRFAERYTSPSGGYTLAEHMDWPDWQREIAWRAHKRQNIVWGSGHDIVWKQVFAELAARPCDLEPADLWQDELSRKMHEYARDRGLMVIMPGFMGEVPAEFVAAHPEVRYVGGIRWGETPMPKHVYPADPMFHALSVRYIRAYTARYGPAHFYFVPPYPEASPGETPEEKRAIKLDLAAAVQRALDEAAPDMVWLADSWAFLTADFWPPEEVRAFCDAVHNTDRFRIYDTWGEERPMWPLHNAFWGKQWMFGVLHCFGSNTTLRGDLHALVRDVRQVARDPRTADCVGLCLVPEVLHHNDLYFDLAMRLAWDPDAIPTNGRDVELGPFLREYALRRYGPDSAPRMAEVLGALARTVYASKDMTQPLYLHQLFTIFDFPNASVYAPPDQVARAPLIRKALEKALKEAYRQRDNPLYERDIIDMARRYLGDVFNGVVPAVIYAWRAGDTPRFERASQDALAIPELTEDILWSSPRYRLATHLEKSANRPNAAQLAEQSRNVMSIWEGSSNLDYPRRDDLAELIHGYYLPRLRAWIQRLDAVSPDAWSQEDDDWLTQAYWDIGKKWVAEGVQMNPPNTSFVEQTRRALTVARRIEESLARPTRKTTNLDFSRGLEGWSLSARRMNLSLKPEIGPDAGAAFEFQTWPDSSGGNLYLFQTVKGNSAEISLDCRVSPCGESAFAGLRVEGYDEAFQRVVECTYQWGDAWNYWPDRYRPDNATPDWTVGATGFIWWWVGHYTFKQRLGPGDGEWHHLVARPAEDVDRVHGEGTWARLGVKTLRIALVASTRRQEDPLTGAFANLRVQVVSPRRP